MNISSTDATGTRNRSKDVSYLSGLCVKCIETCPGMCEVGKSAYRGPEAIYPEPFGQNTSGAQKKYPVDFSDFTIMGTAFGANGVTGEPIFPNVNLDTKLGSIPLRIPLGIPGLGSTDIAAKNWEGLAIGAAISGIYLTIGENVVGMDDDATIENNRVVDSPELTRRVKLFQDWQQDGYGAIIVQSNVEDTNLGVLEYALTELGVNAVELKWGQGAKNIGGEVKISNLEKAQLLHDRNYIVLPNPYDPDVIESFRTGEFKEFERHSRLGMGDKSGFIERVQDLRELGAEYIFLKTGAYRPEDLAKAVVWSSEAGIDALTIDGAGGGTGMSPWRMMNEWGIPPIEIASLTIGYADRVTQAGGTVPDLVLAGGFSLEDHVFKGLSLGAPYTKAIGMARAPLTASMVGTTLQGLIDSAQLPSAVALYGQTREQLFVGSLDLRQQFPDKYDEIPTSAIGVYTYIRRLRQGLQQLLAGARKFDVSLISRDDIGALTPAAESLTGIPLVTHLDRQSVNQVFEDFNP